MANKAELLTAMHQHLGKSNGVHVKHLAQKLDATERAVRLLIKEAREDGHPICGKPESGYYLAATQEELQETINFLLARAKTSLDQADRLKHAPLPQPREQLSLV